MGEVYQKEALSKLSLFHPVGTVRSTSIHSASDGGQIPHQNAWQIAEIHSQWVQPGCRAVRGTGLHGLLVWHGDHRVRSTLQMIHRESADLASSTIGQPSFYTSLDLAPQGEAGYGRTAEYIGAFNGVNCAGSAIGAAICSWTADKYGRKRTIQIAAIVLVIGAAICAGSINNGMFMAGRLINGLGIGALVTCIPIYQAEVSTPESRGFMVSMHVSQRCGAVIRSLASTDILVGCHVRDGLHPLRMARLRRVLHLR